MVPLPSPRDPFSSLISVLLYIGPDLLMPLASALAAIAGVLVMFWQRVVLLARLVWTKIFRRRREPRA
jgi:hypothetical protein